MSSEPETLIEVRGLKKTFKTGVFIRKRVEAVKGVTFDVRRGEIFGFLGPNGAGKTTTIKVLMGLIAPTAGDARLFGRVVPEPASREKVGFLPENPYFYPYLTPREFITLCAQLSGLGYRAARARSAAVIEQVGMTYAADRPARKLSKGMLQRTGIAAALVADPELLILDEPMSGLDPTGRKEVRDLILQERQQGRTIFFSTHILSDVEAMCDEVTILRRGQVVLAGKLQELLRKHGTLSTEIVVVGSSEKFVEVCQALNARVQVRSDRTSVVVESEGALQRVLACALEQQLEVVEAVPRHASLEKLFVDSAEPSHVEREQAPPQNGRSQQGSD